MKSKAREVLITVEEYETNNLSSIDDDNEISDTDQTSEVIVDQEETTDDSWYEE